MKNGQRKLIRFVGILGMIAVVITGTLLYYTVVDRTEDEATVFRAPEATAVSSVELTPEEGAETESAYESSVAEIMSEESAGESSVAEAMAESESESASVVSAAGVTEEESAVESAIPEITEMPSEEVTPEITSEALESEAAESEPGDSVVPLAAPDDANFDITAELKRSRTDDDFWEGCPPRDIELLTPNPYSRPQDGLEQVDTLVIHYVANAGSSAMQNRDYFESLKNGEGRSASAHFIIGLEGEIVQCIPLSEIAYAVVRHNYSTLSIECCHPTDEGWFNEATKDSLIELAAWLCMRLHIDPWTIVRHYDLTGKDCPIYYIEHPDEWEELKGDIAARYYELIG